ncbi:hypothetical protein GCM10010472_30590 [Pseudonocardia halophobica]|uniref:Uncharacterized protein n=1 Tax=Pseudonocardia halophobica TaxID=29401 RepID=A0A9W6KXW9_9PSEU|nr:hypothetical protein GCM10017577_04580 [Pseudonocardia halophobica]
MDVSPWPILSVIAAVIVLCLLIAWAQSTAPERRFRRAAPEPTQAAESEERSQDNEDSRPSAGPAAAEPTAVSDPGDGSAAGTDTATAPTEAGTEGAPEGARLDEEPGSPSR